MRVPYRIAAIYAAATVAIVVAVVNPSRGDESWLLSMGPRIGFSTTTPLLGKQQTVGFHLYDLAALWRLPWHRSLRDGRWDVGTRLLTSIGIIEGAETAGLVSTVVPDLALTGWGGLVSLDAGVGAGVFSRLRFGSQDFGGPAQIVGTLGVAVTPITHGYVGFRLQHFSDGGLYGADALGVDMYVLELGYTF